MSQRDVLFAALILGGAGALASTLAPPRVQPTAQAVQRPSESSPIVAELDRAIRARWREQGLTPAPRALDLAVLRRLSLALTGTIPALEAIRRFEVRPVAGRLASWRDELLADRRASDYLAERLARAFVGTEGGPFLVYRRRRLVAWLGDELHRNRPYDAVVRDLIAGRGVWTDHPATNFVSVTYDPDRKAYDPERLAARVARAFLGVRIDCAQCHDHPFQPWKRADFQGLAAYFGQVEPSITGITDGRGEFRVGLGKDGQGQAIEPRVPFLPRLESGQGPRRERLAWWLTDPRNDRFALATANRAWALLFGRPLVEPIDDLTSAGEPPAVLRLLADDFARHGFDFRRLLRTIAATEAFALDSATEGDSPASPSLDGAGAAFPISRLRPEQVAAATIQVASTGTIDARSHILLRLATFGGINDFVARHGDLGEDEFHPDGTSTIPQRLLLMNGDLVEQNIREDLANLSGRIAAFATDDPKAVEAAYLATLTRRPTPAESVHFEARLAGTRGDARKAGMTDLLWVLLNSTEFSYNH